MNEGLFIKFSAFFEGLMMVDEALLTQLNRCRQRLRGLGMIGAYASGELAGVGFGNLSCRTPRGFMISATRTGHIPVLSAMNVCEVVDVDLDMNCVTYLALEEQVEPSSECMTHSVLYAADKVIGAVLHVHHGGLWKRLLHDVPTTSSTVEYGTPEMGRELARLYRTSDLPQRRVAVMAGHEDGIVFIGCDLEEAERTLLSEYRRLDG